MKSGKWRVACVSGLMLSLAFGARCAETKPADVQTLDFGVYWPPVDSTGTNTVGRRPLLQGQVTVRAERAADGVTARLRVSLTRPSDEASRAFWNARLAYSEHEWMGRVRVWDADHRWLWPNLAYLLRIHGIEREERYGGIDPGKGKDNDFAAVLIRVQGSDAPLVAAEWYPVGVEDADKWTVVQTVRSDEFVFRLGGARQTNQVAAVWLVYADFMGTKPPTAWPQELEYSGGILGYFEVACKPGSPVGQEIQLTQRTPPRGTGFSWEKWALETRNAADSYSTARQRSE